MESQIPPTPPSSNNQTPVPVGQPIPGTPPSGSTKSSTNALMSLILGILSLTCCGFISGIPSIFIGRSELKAIDEGRSPETNRALAKIGMILGIIGTVLSCLGGLIYIILFALGMSASLMEGAAGTSF